MNIQSVSVMAAVAVGVTVTTLALSLLVTRRRRRHASKSSINEVVFFSPVQRAPYSTALTHDGVRRLVQYIGTARRSVDVCVFVFTCRRLAEALVEAAARPSDCGQGVCVRVLMDQGMAADSIGCRLGALSEAGIQVRLVGANSHGTDSSAAVAEGLMHHKFAVLDGRLVMCGSFNWTRQAATCNHEHVVITNNSAIVTKFSEEFERLWRAYN